jgi:hypothetical protein
MRRARFSPQTSGHCIHLNPDGLRACRDRVVEAFSLDGNSNMSDFQIADHGTVISIRPLNDAAREWLNENVVSEPWQWVQGALCVEARFARDLLKEIEEAGFEISR